MINLTRLPLLRRFFNRERYELSRDLYISTKVREQDRTPLIELVDNLWVNLGERGFDSAILAVGSSTFPDSHWQEKKEFMASPENTFKLDLPLGYQDIDLRVVPSKPFGVLELKERTVEVLKARGYKAVPHGTTTMGYRVVGACACNHDGTTEKGFSTFVDFDYVRHCITTQLASGTSVDIILDHEGEIPPIASQAIALERKKNHAFAVLRFPRSGTYPI